MEIARIPPLVTVRTLREALGLTSPQVAERMGDYGVDYHADSVLNVERGLRGAGAPALGAFALACGIKPVDIWTEDRVLAAAEALLKNRKSVA